MHGGNVFQVAQQLGCDPADVTDASANLNPLGPPAWLRSALGRASRTLTRYPDPRATRLVQAATTRYGVDETRVVCANGASEALFAAARAAARLAKGAGCSRAIIPAPAYVDYAKAGRMAGLEAVHLAPNADWTVDMPALYEVLAQGPNALVFLGHPANPTGAVLDVAATRTLMTRAPRARFVIDESFADWLADSDRFFPHIGAHPNLLVVCSLTKILCVPGLRIGLALAGDAWLGLPDEITPWAVNAYAEEVGARGLADADYRARTREVTTRLRDELSQALAALPGITVHPSSANYLFGECEQIPAAQLAERLQDMRVLIRVCDDYAHTDARHFRVAVNDEAANGQLVKAMARVLAVPRQQTRPIHVPALMVQGVASNTGKSVLAAALCRILLQEGYAVAPFKAQNMSLNSYVSDHPHYGGEMGRAQVVQAQACRRIPDTRMNPVLLKPTSDVGSQVIVRGHPVGSMRVREYLRYKPTAWQAATQAYDELCAEVAAEASATGGTPCAMVLEGAGSPAEINLQAHDIVNMAMAHHARASVLLAADIDRGGSYAALLGTMECLTEADRARVGGFILNKFRGDASLLAPANDEVYARTGVPVIGAVPWLEDHGLPEEDSVGFAERFAERFGNGTNSNAELTIALVGLPHMANFTDVDALAAEPDVGLRVVRTPEGLRGANMVLIPGSKNTLADLHWLRESGLADAITAAHHAGTMVAGICGGLQMLGLRVDDPHGVESDRASVEGLGLLPLVTQMAPTKTLTRATCTHAPSGHTVTGYEIHHGVTTQHGPCDATMTTDDGAIGYAIEPPDAGVVWGTYLHGVFDEAPFRRHLLNDLREQRGLPPRDMADSAHLDIQTSLDRVATAVRNSLDMEYVHQLLDRRRT